MSIFSKIGSWLSKVFKYVETDLDKIAISVTEGIKTALNDGVLGFIANVLDGLTKSNVPTEIVNIVSANIYKALAVELAIQGIPADPTSADILAFEQSVLAAFNVTSDKSQVYTTLAAQVYGILQVQVNNNTSFTFAVLVNDVEQAYQDYLGDQANNS